MKKIISNLLMCGYVVAALFCCVSCDDDVDIQQVYPFSVETMPVPSRIVKGETIEIRCELKREGRYNEARYTIRMFQFEGKGRLTMDDGTVFLPNDRYPLTKEVFRLYYTSESVDAQSISVWIEDDAMQSQRLDFQFNNEQEEEESEVAEE